MADGAHRDFLLGGQRSGKSAHAERLARQWLDASPDHHAVMLATAQAWDAEMQERIRRHQADRAQRVPGMMTVEEPRVLAAALRAHSHPSTLVVVDCLTLWLTNLTMPADPLDALDDAAVARAGADLCTAIAHACGPVVLVSNEIGWGVVPMGRDVRAFVDALGRLNQQVAAVCDRVTLMAAGLPLVLKGQI